jgi:two-component system sensor histidine kinase ChvG
MAERRGPAGGARLRRSLSLQGLALLAILIALPLLLYSIFARVEAERRALLLGAVRDAGSAIAAGLAPDLAATAPDGFATLQPRLARFADPGRRIVLLFHPTGAAPARFFFVASEPPAGPADMDAERDRLAGLGVLDALARSCAGTTPLTERVAGADGAGSVITSLNGVAAPAGCWAIVIAVSAPRLLAGIDAGAPGRALLLAAAVYAVMAGLILLIFAAVWRNLRRIRARALAPGGDGGFLEVTDVPEMAPVARAIDGMVERLRRTAELLRQAAEDNAHAFKGPIATIRQAVEPLAAPAAPAEQVRSALAAVQASLARLDGLVRSVGRLDAATADLLEIAPGRVDLTALLRGLIADCRQMRAAQAVTIVDALAPDVAVLGEAEAIEGIFENLLENALSFSPPHATVEVALGRDGAMAVASVEDEGPGVAAAALERIFERYYSDRAAAGEAEGAHFGIGLWIARQNARALGGDVAAANRVPRGLAVRVRLPLAP